MEEAETEVAVVASAEAVVVVLLVMVADVILMKVLQRPLSVCIPLPFSSLFHESRFMNLSILILFYSHLNF